MNRPVPVFWDQLQHRASILFKRILPFLRHAWQPFMGLQWQEKMASLKAWMGHGIRRMHAAERLERRSLQNVKMIELRNLHKVYTSRGKSLVILDGLNLGIREGQVVAITGESGSGKSTLLNVIGGLDIPTKGQVIVNRQDITTLGESLLAIHRHRSIGFVFQQHHLLKDFTVMENLVLVQVLHGGVNKHAATERARDLLRSVGMLERSEHLPAELSGGEVQRAAIARAMANRPKILLADEPTGNLDDNNSRKAFEILVDIAKQEGHTVVIVTHSKSLAKRCDLTYELKGKQLLLKKSLSKSRR